jgi:monoamine oxidase
VPEGYGTLITAAMPSQVTISLSTPVLSVNLADSRVALTTPAGTVRARAVIVTASTNVMAGDGIRWPSALDPWREAARHLPLGSNEKLFLEIVGASPFEDETHVLGNPHDASTGSYYIRPFGQPVIECFVGGAGARAVAERGDRAAFERATDQLVALFGNDVRRNFRQLVASSWTQTASIGGGYSHALPGHAASRSTLARPFDGRFFFAGEATHITDFSTAHGAFQSGVRAAQELVTALAG